MGRADYFPIRPWDLAADTLNYGAGHIRALLIIFAVPELFRIAAYVVNEKARQAYQRSEFLPNWFMDNFLSCAVSAVVFTGIVRHIVLAREPRWLPERGLIRNYLLTAAVLVVVANILFLLATASSLIPPYIAEGDIVLWSIAIYGAGILATIVLIAAIYPSMGMTAAEGRLSLHRMLRWEGKYFPRFMLLTFLLTSACWMVQSGYWWLFHAAGGSLSTTAGVTESPDLNSLMAQLAHAPMDFLFDCTPAVAIGLLYSVLKANSADL